MALLIVNSDVELCTSTYILKKFCIIHFDDAYANDVYAHEKHIRDICIDDVEYVDGVTLTCMFMMRLIHTNYLHVV